MGSPTLKSLNFSYQKVFGVYEYYSIAKGLQADNITLKRRTDLLETLQDIQKVLKEEEEYLRYDYLYSFGSNPSKGGGGMTLSVDGKHSSIWVTPGYCYLHIDHKEVVILRPKQVQYNADGKGLIKIHRRRKEERLTLIDEFEKAIDFLESVNDNMIEIRHRDK